MDIASGAICSPFVQPTASAIVALLKFFPVPDWIAYYINNRRHRAAVRRYIPSMTRVEKEILGYLLARGQTTFIAAQDCGYAMPLISNRIVVMALVGGQIFDAENVPFAIPPHVWTELNNHKSQFPLDVPHDDLDEHPWRIPWNLR